MRTIEIDDDVFGFLLGRANGEPDLSAVLRRELGIPPPGSAMPAIAANAGDDAKHIAEFLRSGQFLRAGNATDRYLAVLGFLAAADEEAFRERVLPLSGRSRQYFGPSRDAIEASGRSTYPHQIPGTSFWAMTNADTGQKRFMLRRAMETLRYSDGAISLAENVLA